MRSRVIPGSFVTIERRVPVRRLKRVDLPTLGRPTITMDGSSFVMVVTCGNDRGLNWLATWHTRLTRCTFLRTLERFARRMACDAFEEFWPGIEARLPHEIQRKHISQR